MATTDPRFAYKHIQDAGTAVRATEDKLQEESSENRRAFERFYNSLAIFSGGTIALSVTYLGYLKTLGRPIAGVQLLIGSWIGLWTAVVTSLFTPFFHTYYIHFARLRELVSKKARQREVEAEGIDLLPVVNIRTPSQREAVKSRLMNAAQSHSKDEVWAARREEIYVYLWVWFGRTGHISFAVGLTLLLWFAVRNI